MSEPHNCVRGAHCIMGLNFGTLFRSGTSSTFSLRLGRRFAVLSAFTLYGVGGVERLRRRMLIEPFVSGGFRAEYTEYNVYILADANRLNCIN
ncbi:MAG: hypothetical protein RR254_08535 [Muribaculaceae bacterium]